MSLVVPRSFTIGIDLVKFLKFPLIFLLNVINLE